MRVAYWKGYKTSEIADGRSPVSEVGSEYKAVAEGATRPSVKQFQESEIADGQSPVSEVGSEYKAVAEGATRPSVKQFQDSKRNVATLD